MARLCTSNNKGPIVRCNNLEAKCMLPDKYFTDRDILHAGAICSYPMKD